MNMYSRTALAAVAALTVLPTANAAFVYVSSARSVDLTSFGSTVDSDSTAATGSWYGSASAVTSSFNALITQGSELASNEMTFAGAAQLDVFGSSALVGTSRADVTFLSDSTESITWITNLWREASGGGNSASISLMVTNVATGSVLLAFAGPALGSGSFDVAAGSTYRVQLVATATGASAGDALSNYNLGFFSTVPAPGAIALLGLAGLVARRRR
jgi:hypothetical protein